jgi:hypothetical protein
MADIDIQRKESPNWIWWVVGAVILGLIALWLLMGIGRDQVAVVNDSPVAAPVTEPIPGPIEVERALPAQVQQYQANCAERQPGDMGVDHTHTSQCLRQLADAIAAVMPADRLAGVEADLTNARDAAQRLEASGPDAMNHSQMAREGMTSISSALQTAQRQWHPELAGDVQEVTRNAERVEPGVPLLEQREPVQQFFSRAGQVLDRIAGARV